MVCRTIILAIEAVMVTVIALLRWGRKPPVEKVEVERIPEPIHECMLKEINYNVKCLEQKSKTLFGKKRDRARRVLPTVVRCQIAPPSSEAGGEETTARGLGY